jgi:predicted transcriptional regulator
MESKKLVPYSVYIPEEYYLKLKAAAKERKASVLIRDAIMHVVDGKDAYGLGYSRGLADAAKVIYDCEEAQMIAVKGKDLGVVLAERIKELGEK